MRYTILTLAAMTAITMLAQRSSQTITEGWEFTKVSPEAEAQWQQVRVPHDWAIYGPFDINNDLQIVAVEQNGETEKTMKTGRTGGLPFIGKGAYRTTINIPDTTGVSHTLVFDGALSHAHVKVNGKEVAYWPYGYNSFYVNIDDAAVPGDNLVEVDLENYEQASRWYPGAGLYRNVHLLTTNKVHIPVWGTYLSTPYVTADEASVHLIIDIDGASKGQAIDVNTQIISPEGKVVADNSSIYYSHGQPFAQNFMVEKPQLWSTSSPNLYEAVTTLSINGKTVDSYTTRFGIRSLEYLPTKGFFLNGEYTKFRGVCLHHDLGALGAAVNRSAMRYQLELLKDIGVNAVRTAHNMPDPQFVELCDEMGIMLMVEPFDDWSFRPKTANGYGSLFTEWAEKDMVNMLHQYRNHPSVVMWSIGNEVPSQWGPDGVSELEFLQDICHREDPTRPVTCGMDQASAVLTNGFAAALDIPGFNYKPHFYVEAYDRLPQKLILGTETASTVSSRGVYDFPMVVAYDQLHPDNQSSSYDVEYCFWSNIPDLDFAADDDYPWMIGQFVWTGFDYIGEPSPYDTDAWPSHSSLFGIFDLAFLPKDRAYLYRSVWNTEAPTLYVLPHWTWPGREGQVTPVMVYTSWPQAELFVNGVSQGIRTKETGKDIQKAGDINTNHYPEKSTRESMDRYRLVWDDVVYEPGEITVVAYDENGNKMGETSRKTAGKPHHLKLTPNRTKVEGNGEELVYFTVTVEDKDGNPVPTDSRLVKFTVEGAGEFEATANGDPTCVMPFQNPEMKLFSGAATAIARATKPGTLTLKATAKGVKPATATVTVL